MTATMQTPGRKLIAILATLVTAVAIATSAAPASASLGLEPYEDTFAGFGLLPGFDGKFLDENGDLDNRAGAHPFTAGNEFFLTSTESEEGWIFSTESLKDTVVGLPPGLLANPQGYPTCTEEQLVGTAWPLCPPESQIGTVTLWVEGFAPFRFRGGGIPLYNMVPPHGVPAAFGFNFASNLTHIYATVRTGNDYGINLSALNVPEAISLGGIGVNFWGVPSAPGHTPERVCPGVEPGTCTVAPTMPELPFVSLPTSCTGEASRFEITVTGWLGGSGSDSFLTHDEGNPVPLADGCPALGTGFQPAVEARPTTSVADSPAGLDVDIQVPQNDDPGGRTTAHVKDVSISLPEGLTVNPASANGLDGCSPAEIDMNGSGPGKCPNASKLGTAVVDTPLLEDPLRGAVYLADPYDNPFNSLIALYIALHQERTGVVIKLAGKVTSDPQTGKLDATFENNPELPFSSFKVNFFGGAGASLRTPATCASYTSASVVTPWSAPDSGPPSTPSDSWTIDRGPAGNCASTLAQLPNSPSFEAGTVSPIAKAHSPFVVNLSRPDGSQEFSSVTVSPPPGLLAKLAGTAICPGAALLAAEAKSGAEEKAAPSCPAASEVGNVFAAAGAGPAPYNAPGKAYLSGPYKGAPLSLAIVTPAVAGPFDLGTIVVRTAVHLDPQTAQITAVSDPIPPVLKGIVLDIRSVSIRFDRPGFMLNPTSCNPMAVNAQLTSTLGQPASLASRFQVGECGRLAFKPRLNLRLRGATKRTANPRLIANLGARPGDANISRARVTLPPSAFLDQSHIRTVCTRVQWAADNCPRGSIYGRARATSPLVDYAVSGNVYLRSSSNKLPDLVADLRGPAHQPIRVELAGRTDSVKGALRNTFTLVPDVPVTSFRLELFGGKRGLVVNSRDLCRHKGRAQIVMRAQNGRQLTTRPVVQVENCAKKRKKRSAAKKR